ncbi:PREDICTED: heat shock protein beta-9 [Chinchilla lanigera]|uniref:heat shock protein beta-9 n=1 Tax=Chinchilla lanigera TaxID=34839 RepID=UPI00038EC48A|nr:PREDICTED: heat shock protein beta-9 [Chinchilla lanigera]
MRRVGSSVSNDRGVTSPAPSTALAEPDRGATLPVRLLRDVSAAAQNTGQAQGFQMRMDARGFAPEELQVRVDGQNLVVTGQRQEEHRDPRGGSYSLKQKVYRQMQLPGALDPATATCSLTPSGQLWVRGPCRPPPLPESPPAPSRNLTRQGSKKGPGSA